jgi:hypothetical protein
MGHANRSTGKCEESTSPMGIALPRGFGCGASILLGHWAVCPSSKSVILFQFLQWMKRAECLLLAAEFVF